MIHSQSPTAWPQPHQRLARLEGGVQKEQRSNFIEVGKLLAEIWDHQLHTFKGYRSFVKYVDEDSAFKFTGKHAVRLVRTYRFIKSLPPDVCVPTSERQVRPLIKLGFTEARMVWIEAQTTGSRQGKLVTGEMVAEIVNRLKKQDPREESMVRQATGVVPKQGCGIGEPVEPAVPSSEKCEADAPNSSGSEKVPMDKVLLLADFEALRTRANLLDEGERNKLLLEWRNALDNELSTTHSSSVLLSGHKRSLESAYLRNTAVSCSNAVASEDSTFYAASSVSHFSCKKRRTGFRKPRRTMPVFRASSEPLSTQGSAGRSTGESLAHVGPCDSCCGSCKNCWGMGLLLNAVTIISKAT